jgi:hypothetical protein
MGSWRQRSTCLTVWMLGLAMVASCAKGSSLEPAGGAGGLGGNGGETSTSSTTTVGSTTGSSTTTSSGATTTSSGATTTSSSTTTSSTSVAASSSSGVTCFFPQHLCGGMCVDNTVATGCANSIACSPCPTPTHGTAACNSGGACDVTCPAGYAPNASKTDCDAIPPPPTCCDDSDCAIFTICLDGYCKNPLGATCDPAQCDVFCKCTSGGTPTSTGQCMKNVFVWECLCSP